MQFLYALYLAYSDVNILHNYSAFIKTKTYCCNTKLQILFKYQQFSQQCPFSVTQSNPGCYITICHYIS